MPIICKICSNPIRIGDDITILSYPIRVVGKDGEYNFSDFLRNEFAIHFSCFNANSIRRQGKEINNKLLLEFKLALDSLKIDYDISVVESFLDDNKTIKECGELLRKWFSNKK